MAQDAPAQDSTPTYFNPTNPTLTPSERDGLAISQDWLDRSATGQRPVAGAEGAVVFLFGAAEPSIVCAVLQICDVQLQAGEQVNSINVGDSARWLIEPAVSNSGPNETQHLIIKPMDVNLSTSLVVTTDRRTYQAQSAPSCDFGQVGERFGNVAFGIDDGNHRRGQFAPS
jgi:type IV secretion system protein VirB9